MKISQLLIYPIKSLRPISIQSATLCPQGLAYDRRYVLLKRSPDGEYNSIWVGGNPEMALFHCSFSSGNSFTVTYHAPSPPVAPPTPSQQISIEIPFEPEKAALTRLDIHIHTEPNYPAYRMPDAFNVWFTECFGFSVVLAYLGDGIGIRKQGDIADSWISSLAEKLPPASLSSINFSDGSPLLIVSESSLQPLHERLDGEKAVVEKFRPNIVIQDPSVSPWDEDYWGEIFLPRLGARIILTANCARCISINVDLEKGKFGAGESGKLLKKMMKDRRVDPGKKWEPIFGRYGFPTSGGEIRVGDEVKISVRNNERTVWNGVIPKLTQFEPSTIAT